MRSKTRQATITKHSMIGALHWYVSFEPHVRGQRLKKFNEYGEARQFALQRVYARNIIVHEDGHSYKLH